MGRAALLLALALPLLAACSADGGGGFSPGLPEHCRVERTSAGGQRLICDAREVPPG
jgi:hypothetical protein